MKRTYQVKKIGKGTMVLLSVFDTLDKASDYAVSWSNENNQSSFIYWCDLIRASYFTHKVADNDFELRRG